MILQKYEKCGWSWRVGWSSTRNSYIAEAWKDLKNPVVIKQGIQYRDYVACTGKSTGEAETKLIERLEARLDDGDCDET